MHISNQEAHRIGWIWLQIRWKNEGYVSEIKENAQGTNSDGKETGTQVNGVDQKEERNIQPEQNEEIRIQKNEERVRNLQDIFKYSNIRIIGVPTVNLCIVNEDHPRYNVSRKAIKACPGRGRLCLLGSL